MLQPFALGIFKPMITQSIHFDLKSYNGMNFTWPSADVAGLKAI